MTKKIVLIFSALFLCSSLFAQEHMSPRQWANAADVANSKKDYPTAIADYQQAINGGYSNFGLLYSLACVYSLQNNSEQALLALEKSAAMGLRSASILQNESDLNPLHSDPHWAKIVAIVTKNEQAYHVTHNDPNGFKFVTSDIDLFWKTYDQLPTAADPALLWERNYLDRGTVGLQGFIFSRIQSGEFLNKMIQSESKFYAGIRKNTLQTASVEPRVRTALRKFKSLYPEANFPDVYFVIGNSGTGGTSTNDGLVVGTEIFSLSADVPIDELNDWQKSVIKTPDLLPSIVIHELMHFQQNYDSPEMLASVIKEGAADFLASLVVDGNFNQRIYDYGYVHEAELKQQFLLDMKKNDATHWLYNGGSAKGSPADLGYFMGFRITQAYYQRATDKKQAVVDILNINDFNAFVAQSGYFDGK
ncbi:tetratricopeptide repeat protein [Solimicrobium silvestre]|uniref:DUF2268 domain-containing protein n=1 Tax=Solimicrobium silvestre TaxID=2099400 RepID=A0A2S9H059_9BURK|nr:tetratricopeptide repeat protein [Solimicrobium silvestre]PRC93256.1 hypothetical protein S2091_1994 [Solimicrobium silvestre]